MTLSGRIVKGYRTVYQNSVTDACALANEARERGAPTAHGSAAPSAHGSVAPSAHGPAAPTAHSPAASSVHGPGAPERSFHDKLECCLLYLCRDADIPVPMWLSSNSKEFGRFRKTSFYAEQFNEKVNFDRFEIKLIDN